MDIKLETERLIVRENRWEDLEDLHRLLSGPEMHFLQDIRSENKADSEENLRVSTTEACKTDREKYFLAIEEKETGAFVGQIGFTVLEKYPGGHISEMGYFILEEFWGKGYVTEAAKAVLKFAFQETNCHKMLIGCNVKNTASENIMKKLGAKKEAHFESHQYLDGKWCDRVVYGAFSNN